MTELTEIIVPFKGMFVPFEWRDNTPGGSSLGRAEFIVCQIYKRGKLVEYYVYPTQQRNVENYWHFTECGNYSDFSIRSYEDLLDPRVWLSFWCKEHKTISMRIYVPNDARFLWLHNSGIAFTRTDWSKRS